MTSDFGPFQKDTESKKREVKFSEHENDLKEISDQGFKLQFADSALRANEQDKIGNSF